MKKRYLSLLVYFAPMFAMAAETPAKHIVVIAHRGAHRSAPENSLAAIRKAAELGCDYVEVDVRTTHDGRLVLMHDSTVDRTTDGTGKVAEMTLAEIRRLRFGSKWPDERVPTFDEALAVCKGRIKVYIDHKKAAPDKILAALEKRKMLGDVVVYGSVKTLRMYKKQNPKVWIMPPHPGSPDEIKKLIADLKPETLDGNIVNWNIEQVTAAHKAGAQVWVDNPGSYDTKEGVSKAIRLNVDAIQTDHPQRLIELLKARGLRKEK